MGAVDQTRANQVLDAILATTVLTASTSPIRCRLMTTNGTVSTNGTELTTGGGYTAAPGAANNNVTFAAAGTGSAASNVAVTINNMPAPAGGSIVGVELWDSAGTPKRQAWGALTASKTVNAGDTFSIASGALTLALT